MSKIFLDESDLRTLGHLAERAQDLAHQARLAQLSVDAFIRLIAAKNRLDPEKEYKVTPRGELVEIAPPPASPLSPPGEGQSLRQEAGGEGAPATPAPDGAPGDSLGSRLAPTDHAGPSAGDHQEGQL